MKTIKQTVDDALDCMPDNFKATPEQLDELRADIARVTVAWFNRCLDAADPKAVSAEKPVVDGDDSIYGPGRFDVASNLIILRRDADEKWFRANPILRMREPAIVTDLKKVKIGNGITRWRDLPYCESLFQFLALE